MRRAAVSLWLLLALPGTALGAPPRAQLTDIEQQVMCVSCGVPLAIAESPQAERERAYIRDLIARGEGTGQIKRELVAQYGPNVLALPAAKGFDLAVYLAPVALVAALLVALALALPRWRGRQPGGPGAAAGRTGALSSQDEARLAADLARYDP
ncbi:MAG: hypothetical protein NVSMB51_14050 [Solirubrobacteraceae bacterium]